MTCINCGEGRRCLCWTCLRPVLIYAVLIELVHAAIRSVFP